jgi:hypothetical protein
VYKQVGAEKLLVYRSVRPPVRFLMFATRTVPVEQY